MLITRAVANVKNIYYYLRTIQVNLFINVQKFSSLICNKTLRLYIYLSIVLISWQICDNLTLPLPCYLNILDLLKDFLIYLNSYL